MRDIYIDEIKRHEGLELEAYWDDLGEVWTIGWGHAKNVQEGDELDEYEAECILYDDIKDAKQDCKSIYGTKWIDISIPRRSVLIGMAFNLGRVKLSQFVRMNAAIMAGDWHVAAMECLDSRARRQHDELENPRYREYATTLLLDQTGWRGPWRGEE